MTDLRATYRLQFHRDFPIERATGLVPYFAQLGVSHIYASPLLKARPGSTHGYDIVDHNEINPELGGEPALRELVAALRAHHMGLILDIVPNHMGVGGADNAWWLDVLEWGRDSPYAEYFDVDWDSENPAMRGKLLAPFLGASYGDALNAGDIKLVFDDADGRFVAMAYGAHRFPIALRDYTEILRSAHGPLDTIAERFAGPGPGGRDAVRRRGELNRAALVAVHARHPHGFETALAAYDPSGEEGRKRLHFLLERQAYRLTWWRAATDEINWRRFFDINGLAGMRQEVPEVFDATHATVLRLYAEALIDGVRIDHVDGLADPRGYCRKLRRKLETAREARPAGSSEFEPIVWVEKILFPHESLPASWLTDGTTGYDFMNEVAAVLHDPDGEKPLTDLWTRLTGRPGDFDAEARPARRQILRQALSSELNATAALFHRILQRDLTTRDWTVTSIRRALEEILVHFHTYRIYSGLSGASDNDRRDLDWAMAGARRTIRKADADLLELVGAFIAGTDIRGAEVGPHRNERLRAMVRFQQLSAPTAAKSVEDTAFYRYGRLLSRNEVGSEPSQFAMTPIQFHVSCEQRLKQFPRALLATATHDHKRGEDTRMRLAALSEIPDAWEQALTRWTRLNAPLRRDLGMTFAPDGADEVMIYQMIVAAWPLDLAADDAEGLTAYRDRLAEWLEKAVREAKRESEWAAPNEAYETACREFLASNLDPARSAPLAQELCDFANRIAGAGAINSLSQTLLRLTAPGIPDLYQGAEFWDFSLVDPDNRRPVDFPARAAALNAAASPVELAANWRDGRLKQAIIARVLALRKRAPELFASGAYERLAVEGPMAQHVVAFVRSNETHAILVAAPRLSAGLLEDRSLAFSPGAWAGTSILLGRHVFRRSPKNIFAADVIPPEFETTQDRVDVDALFRKAPVALLEDQ